MLKHLVFLVELAVLVTQEGLVIGCISAEEGKVT